MAQLNRNRGQALRAAELLAQARAVKAKSGEPGDYVYYAGKLRLVKQAKTINGVSYITMEGLDTQEFDPSKLLADRAARALAPGGVKVGDTLKYNDGRQGHQDVTAEVLEVEPTGMVVKFSDRYQETFISWTDQKWMKYLSRV